MQQYNKRRTLALASQTASYWRPERKYSVLASCSRLEQAAISRSAWSLNSSDLLLLLSLFYHASQMRRGWLFSVMATTCRSKLINGPRTFPGLSADQQKVFFLYLPSYICWNTFEMGSELEESHQELSSQSCRRQSRSPLLLFELYECLSRLTFCSA